MHRAGKVDHAGGPVSVYVGVAGVIHNELAYADGRAGVQWHDPSPRAVGPALGQISVVGVIQPWVADAISQPSAAGGVFAVEVQVVVVVVGVLGVALTVQDC